MFLYPLRQRSARCEVHSLSCCNWSDAKSLFFTPDFEISVHLKLHCHKLGSSIPSADKSMIKPVWQRIYSFFFFLAQKSSAIFKHYIYVIKWSCKLMFCLLKMIILFKFRDHSPMKGTNSKYYFLIHLLWNNLFLWPKSSQRQTIFYCFLYH